MDAENRKKIYRRYYRKHRAEIRARKRAEQRVYRAQHHEQVLERAAAARAANRELGRRARDEAAASGATKRCPKCREAKSVAEFHIDGSRKDGLRAQCRSCHCAYSRKRGAARDPRSYRRVAEAALGRKLARGETVHHINCNHDDDRPENLHVFRSRAQHQRAHGSLNKLVETLVEQGVIRFSREAGRYEFAAP